MFKAEAEPASPAYATLLPARPAQSFLDDCLSGVSASPKSIPCKWLYDAEGSRLFERICALPEYYPARAEIALLRDIAGKIACSIEPGTTLVEFGSGASVKTRLLLDAAPAIVRYVPIDISRDALMAAAALIVADYPRLKVEPLCADFTDIGALELPPSPLLGFFPGSTLGNFAPSDAVRLLADLRRAIGSTGKLLLGLDLAKDASILVPAYDDAQGITAAFNRNLLSRMQRELHAHIDPDMFDHRAIWNAAASRIEMHLVAREDMRVQLGKQTFALSKGQSIHTENSYKFDLDTVVSLLADAGWSFDKHWISDAHQFLVVLVV